MTPPPPPSEPPGPGDSVADRLFEIEGTVQGVGFRPFVFRIATRHGLRGWARNDGRGVAVRASGSPESVAAFAAALAAEAPPAARVVILRERSSPGVPGLPPLPGKGFVILASEAPGDSAPTAAVTPDLALCPDCRRELADPSDRRHAYPFITCTCCGPRYSIVRELPYDRPRTTMAGFAMCPDCRREYDDPADRRHHSQPNACPVCGPQMQFVDASGRKLAARGEAIAAAADALRSGRIVAVKGVGGFHLMADATNNAAVEELRRRKHREEKPLAVMFPSLESLRAHTGPTEEEVRWLTSAAAPIVLVRKREDSVLSPAVAPGNPWVGALLPYSPLHVLLLEAAGRPVVATSGNLSEEPLCFENDDARRRLAAIADLFLEHDRPIARPVDDSLVRSCAGGPLILRRARGHAPAPISLLPGMVAAEPMLCVGGHLKNTVAVTVGDKIVLSPHIGDLSNPASMEAFRRTVDLLGSLYREPFRRVACDQHPDYASTRFAHSLGLPVVSVQHHLAHVLACLLEHGGGPERVLGVSWDGTGFGTDGTVWGGEFIAVDRVARTAQRVARLRPFRLPGGEAAVREPRRSALGLLHALFADDTPRFERAARPLGFGAGELRLLRQLLDRSTNAPVTTSAGRLFDGIAALLGLRLSATFEGQAAMDLEFAADGIDDEKDKLIAPITTTQGGAVYEIDWGSAVAGALECAEKGEVGRAAARFHGMLARSIAAVAARVGIGTVALTGGCFQNRILLDKTAFLLETAGFNTLRHRDLPPNDGNIAAGQALGTLWGITSVTISERPPAAP